MSIGSRIKERRKSLGLSVDDIAERLGKNRATIYRYESDDIENLPSTVLEPLAKVLRTTPAHLMGWDDNEQQAAEEPESYYYDNEVAAIANEMKENPGLRVLFDASRKLYKESIEEVRRFIEFQRAKERGDYED